VLRRQLPPHVEPAYDGIEVELAALDELGSD
jgi:hypothetical protein